MIKAPPTKWRPTLDAKTNVVRVNMTIPRDLLIKFKAWCAAEGVTVSGAVSEMMAREVE